MINLKLSVYLKIMWLNPVHKITTDFLLYSLRTKGVIRISEKFMNIINSGDIMALPQALIVLLLKFEMLIPADIDEESSLKRKNNAMRMDNIFSISEKENALSDLGLLNYSREQSLINF